MKKRLESSTWRVNPVEERQNRPRGDFGGQRRRSEEISGARVCLTAGRGFYIGPVRRPGDPATSRDAPGDPGTCAGRPDWLGFGSAGHGLGAGRPGTGGWSTRRLTEPSWATRAPVAGRPGLIQYRSGSTRQSCRLTRLSQKRSKET
jgi:hypothetical protein